MNFSVFPCTPSDLDEMVALDRDMWSDWANGYPLYRQLLDLYPQSVMIARSSEGELAGFSTGLYNPINKLAWVINIDIREDFRSQGLGKKFLGHWMEVFDQLQANPTIAIIDPNNIASQRLFSAFGFEVVAVEKDYFGKGSDQLRFERRWK